MSGTVTSNVFKASGVIATTPGGLDWSSAVITGSTLSAETGRGYFINTTSNACTITLPASPAIGDQIVFADYARTWATNNVIIDSNGNNFQGDPDTFTVDYSTAGQSLNIVYSDATKGWLPVSDDAVASAGIAPPTQKAIFAFGTTGGSSRINTSNLVSSSGVVASNTSGVGTARTNPAGVSYGLDKGIFAFGQDSSGKTNVKNLVNNSGVIASDATGVGTARQATRGAAYGGDKAVFAFGTDSSADVAISNKVSNSGVVATDTSAVSGTSARNNPGAVGYGGDKGIFAFGGGPLMNTRNLVSNQGVVAADATGAGSNRSSPSGASYGSDKAIFCFGYLGSDNIANVSNLVSNTGVVASDTAGVGTQRTSLSGNGYGGDKAIIAFGNSNTASTTPTNISNKISNSGVIASDTSGVGESRYQLASAGYSNSA